METLGTKAEWVTIHIDEFERENLAVGGELHSDKHAGRHQEGAIAANISKVK